MASEVATGSNAYSLGYSYDHNGNRLSLSSGESTVQSFTYDAHDKLTSGTGGTAGNETETYDLNGSLTGLSVG